MLLYEGTRALHLHLPAFWLQSDFSLQFSAEFSLHLERIISFCSPLKSQKRRFGTHVSDSLGGNVALLHADCSTVVGQLSYSRRANVLQSVCKSPTVGAQKSYGCNTSVQWIIMKNRNLHRTNKIDSYRQNRVFRTKVKMFFTEALVKVDFLVKFS